MNNQLPETVAAFSIFALVGWVLYLFFRRYQVATHLKSQRIESFNRMIEKFGSAKEFIEFAESPQGKKLLEEPVSPRVNPLNKILRFLQAGVLFIVVGIGHYLNAMRMASTTELPFVYDRMNAYYWGTLWLSLGVGLLLVAGISYIFVQRWHLANGETKS
jgi:hypothetical protein